MVAQNGDHREKRLTAFVVPRRQGTLAAPALRTWLGQKLPDYMLPARFVVLDALPLTPNGKVDRRALEQLQGEELAVGTDYVPPRTELESQLARIWRLLLHRERVGIHDNFFQLGGHSLLLVSVLSRIHRETGVMPPLVSFSENPTIEHLARTVDEQRLVRANHARRASPETTSNPPVFLLSWYLDFEALGIVNQPYYVLPFPEYGGDRERCRIEFIATECLKTLRAIQPTGPYQLAGYSLGGVVAFEMGVRLQAAGETVRLVAIVDTFPPTRLYRAVPAAIGFFGNLFRISFPTQLLMARGCFYAIELAEYCWGWNVRRAIRTVTSHLRRAVSRWRYKRSRREPFDSKSFSPADLCAADPMPQELSFGNFVGPLWAHGAYRPQPYDGFVALFVSDDLASHRHVPGRGWGRWASNLREYSVPGDHVTCVTKYKAELAKKLHECLAEANGLAHRD